MGLSWGIEVLVYMVIMDAGVHWITLIDSESISCCRVPFLLFHVHPPGAEGGILLFTSNFMPAYLIFDC